MSSAYSEPHLEDTSSLDGHENNDKDTKNKNIPKPEQKDKVKKNLKNKYLNKMFNLLKEFLIMVVVAIAYAAITNEPPKVGKSPAAYRFFPDDAYVTDWYRGEISDAINQARSADIAFVMFYAPWDAECQHARKEFQIVARYMHQQITFSAVNCWQPGSECKTQYSKVNKWPILIAYPTHGRGVQYNGPLVAVHMMTFLKKIISPFSKKQAVELMSQHDVIVIGDVNAAPFSRDFNIFYQVALRLLERDPLQEIAVTIEKEDKNIMPMLFIHMWNETLIYPWDMEWEIESILNWILKHIHHLTTWISPSGSKSISLSSYLQPGPALILFTPRNPLATHSDFYSMLREIAFDYNSCGVNQVINKLITIFHDEIQRDRRERYMQHLKLIEECSLKKFKVKRITPANLWSNTSYCLDKKYLTESLHQNNKMINYFGGMNSLCGKFLENFDYGDEVPEGTRVNSGNIVYKTSKLSDIPDYRSPKNLKNSLRKEICRAFLIAQKYQHLAFSSELYNDDVVGFDIKGLKCKTNKTLTFIAMDSLHYHHYAEKLGIDLSKRPNKTAVVILDDKMESHYVLSGEVTESNLRNYIYNYTRGSLKRALSSLATVKSESTHSYHNNRDNSLDNAKFSVKELSATNFLETISQTNKAVIIFYYSKQCSFCNGISYSFLTIAKYFTTIEELLFARVDGDLNLLPWEYTMETYPTILFIPANQVSESRVFPMDMPITMQNLIGFILANLQTSLRLEAMWTLCDKAKLNPNIMDCILSLRLQISQTIDRTLQEWRTSNNKEKSLLSLKLQHLHDLHTLFLQYPHNVTLAENLFDKLKLVEMQPPETKI